MLAKFYIRSWCPSIVRTFFLLYVLIHCSIRTSLQLSSQSYNFFLHFYTQFLSHFFDSLTSIINFNIQELLSQLYFFDFCIPFTLLFYNAFCQHRMASVYRGLSSHWTSLSYWWGRWHYRTACRIRCMVDRQVPHPDVFGNSFRTQMRSPPLFEFSKIWKYW